MCMHMDFVRCWTESFVTKLSPRTGVMVYRPLQKISGDNFANANSPLQCYSDFRKTVYWKFERPEARILHKRLHNVFVCFCMDLDFLESLWTFASNFQEQKCNCRTMKLDKNRFYLTPIHYRPLNIRKWN